MPRPRVCTKNRVSEGIISRSRTPAKLQYEPCVHVMQHAYGICAAKYGRVVRLAPSEIMFFVQNFNSRSRAVLLPGGSQKRLVLRDIVRALFDAADTDGMRLGQKLAFVSGTNLRKLASL